MNAETDVMRSKIEALIRTPDGEREWTNQGRSGRVAVVDVSRLRDAIDSAYSPGQPTGDA